MKKIIIFIMIMFISSCSLKQKYAFGELVSVEVAKNNIKEFYVIDDNKNDLILLAKDSIGTSKYNNIQEGYGCQFYRDCSLYNKYKGSHIETEIKKETSSWKNVISVSLLDLEDLIEKLNLGENFYIENNDDITLLENYDMFNEEFWVYNTYRKSLNMAWTIKNNTISIENIEKELAIKPIIKINKKYVGKK